VLKKRIVMDELTFPCMNVKLVPIEKVISNSYNPNFVSASEMSLLCLSIENDGVTQPVVTFYDKEADQYIVVDGFHRYLLIRDHFKSLVIPVVVIDKDIKDRMASTIRHNRARGKHQVNLVGDLVRSLIEKGWGDVEIAKHLGMSAEELLRLKQITGIAAMLKNKEYAQAWESVDSPRKEEEK
jgi:ParB-like chromosome segregation protein Spo0J